jgi:hypothetical protein
MIGTNTEETAEALWRDLYPSGGGIGVTAKFLHFLYRHTHSRADIDAALSLALVKSAVPLPFQHPDRSKSQSLGGSMTENSALTTRRGAEIDAFLERLQTATPGPTGRLIFALDATASREPTWDHACRIQGEMYEATGAIGGLEIQLIFYRGFSECKSSRWVTTAGELHQLMRSVRCVGGNTQIERILDHALRESQAGKIGALVFVGDCMEERADRPCHLAGELGKLGVPVFMFHEGHEPTAASTFRQIASLSGGAYVPFDSTSGERLKVLLAAVAVYATGGHQALENYARKQGGEVLQLTTQLRGRQ